MIWTIIDISPALMSFSWLLLFSFKRCNKTQVILKHILALASFYFITYALYISPLTNYWWMCLLDTFSAPTILLLLVMLIDFIRAHSPKKVRYEKLMGITRFLYIPIIMFATAEWGIYYVVGYDMAAKYMMEWDSVYSYGPFVPEYLDLMDHEPSFQHIYYFITEFLINILTVVYALVLVVVCAFMMVENGYRPAGIIRFFFRGARTTIARAVSVLVIALMFVEAPLIMFGRNYIP